MKTKTEVLYNENLHFEHKQWQSELAFWEDELKSFKNRLNELIPRWTNKEVLAQLAQVNSGRESLDTALTKKHIEFRNQMETQRQIYADLKKDFFRFLSKTM